MYYKVKSQPTAFFDCDDTLVMWNLPDVTALEDKVISIYCDGNKSEVHVNQKNVDLLIKLSQRGHSIVVWSAGGSNWAEAVVRDLHLEDFVDVVTSKPSYYIDDVKDSSSWMGKYSYFDIDGKVHY